MGERERGPLKKLIGAAEHWLGVDRPAVVVPQVDDEVAEGLRRIGVIEADIAAAQDVQPEDEVEAVFEVHADCWKSVMFFLKVETQWTWVTTGVHVPQVGIELRGMRAGFSYAAVEAGMRMVGIKPHQRAGLLADLQVMEKAVLSAEKKALAGKR